MNPWLVISNEDIESIHQATLQVLNEVGIVLSHPGTIKLLLEAGASVKEDRVTLPPELVENAITKCGKKITIKGRDGREIVLGDGCLHWHNVGGARDVYDPETGQPRQAVIQDVRDSANELVSPAP